MLLQGFKDLFSYRDLLWLWTLRDIRVRYKQSILGAAWAILQPLSLMIMFTVVFSYLVRVPSDGIAYPIFSYTALLPWTFFSTSIAFGVPSIVNNMNLVTKIYFPREILPISAVVASFIDFLTASIVYLGLMVVYDIGLHVTILLVPLLLAVQVLLTLGVVLLASAVNVRFRDVRFIVPIAMQLWMYATPIIYPLSLVPQFWRPLYMLNPMVGLIEAYRMVALKGQWPDPWSLSFAILISVSIFVVGWNSFRRMEVEFADII